MKFIQQFSVYESKRIILPKKVDEKLQEVTEKLWRTRFQILTRPKKIDIIQFKTLDGVDGLVEIWIDPKLKPLGSVDTEPVFSGDPMDFVLKICHILNFSNKTHLYDILYHEMIHAVDPTQSTKFSSKYQFKYKDWTDKDYYGHQIEYTAIISEFLNSLVKYFENHKFDSEYEKLAVLEEIKLYLSKKKGYRIPISSAARKVLNNFSYQRGLNLINHMKKYSGKAYREFLKKFWTTYLEIKSTIKLGPQ